LNAESLDFLQLLNEYIQNDNLNVSLGLRKKIIHTLEKIGSSDVKLPARKSAMLFDSLYDESNHLLAEKFNLPQPLFHVDYSKYPQSETIVPLVRVHEVFNDVNQRISTSTLDDEDMMSWGKINLFFNTRMKSDKLASEYGPDFACIGFPKCATTFILKRFAEFSYDTLVEGEFTMSKLEEYRPKIKEIHDQGRKVAIKNPTIIYNPNHTHQILRSGCKVIVSIRNPVRWLKSFYNYRLKRIHKGLEGLPANFDKIPSFTDIVNHDIDFMGVSVSHGMMAKIITENLLKSEHYDPSRVLFVIQEDQNKAHEELLDFLEIPASTRRKRGYLFHEDKPARWDFFNEDEHDAVLYQRYSGEIIKICTLVNSLTGKDLKSIWENFYSIKIDS
jgi:hypothetical protein